MGICPECGAALKTGLMDRYCEECDYYEWDQIDFEGQPETFNAKEK